MNFLKKNHQPKVNHGDLLSKTLLTLLTALLISIASFAQIGINYKAVLKDASGNLLSDTFMNVQFTIHQSTATGTIMYQEDHNYTTDANGLLILNIGTDPTPITGTFSSIDWAADLHFLQTTITYSGGTINFDATQFLAVPYAISAKSATFKTINNVTSNTPGNLAADNLVFGSTQMDDIQGSDYDNTRLFFNKSKSAFRAGRTSGDGHSHRTKWDNDLIGDNSAAFGFSSEASGDGSFATGSLTEAKGICSVAMGSSSDAIGSYSIAVGENSLAEGKCSVALVKSNASGNYSSSIGFNTNAEAFCSTAVGKNNIGGGNPGDLSNINAGWILTDPLFEIGNGTGLFNKSNALTVLKNGNVGIGRHTPTSLLEVAHNDGTPSFADRTNAFSIRNLSSGRSWQFYTHSTGYLELYNDGAHKGSFNPTSGVYATTSDRRVKKDITPLEVGTLNKVMQLNPVSYLMKDQTDTNRNLGLISQEVQAIFPSITHYVKESDLLTLSYTELIPILIKALQEQQAIIDGQTIENIKQNSTIESLLQRMTALETANN